MAYTRVDAELMTNYVAARNVPAGSHFIAALDQNDELMVFSLSDDPVPKFLLSMCRIRPSLHAMMAVILIYAQSSPGQ